MRVFLDDFLVAAALLVSVGYALFALGPRAWRRGARAAVGRFLARAPRSLRLRVLAERLERPASAPQGACGGCGGCGAETTAGPQAEVSVPLTRISRR